MKTIPILLGLITIILLSPKSLGSNKDNCNTNGISDRVQPFVVTEFDLTRTSSKVILFDNESNRSRIQSLKQLPIVKFGGSSITLTGVYAPFPWENDKVAYKGIIYTFDREGDKYVIYDSNGTRYRKIPASRCLNSPYILVPQE